MIKLSESINAALAIAQQVPSKLMHGGQAGTRVEIATDEEYSYGTRSRHRRVTVNIYQDQDPDIALELVIDLQNPRRHWDRALVEVHCNGTVYRSFHYAAQLRGGTWHIRPIQRILCAEHGPGQMAWDSGWLQDPRTLWMPPAN